MMRDQRTQPAGWQSSADTLVLAARITMPSCVVRGRLTVFFNACRDRVGSSSDLFALRVHAHAQKGAGWQNKVQ